MSYVWGRRGTDGQKRLDEVSLQSFISVFLRSSLRKHQSTRGVVPQLTAQLLSSVDLFGRMCSQCKLLKGELSAAGDGERGVRRSWARSPDTEQDLMWLVSNALFTLTVLHPPDITPTARCYHLNGKVLNLKIIYVTFPLLTQLNPFYITLLH